MKKLLTLFHKDKQLLAQFVIVFAAFFILVLISSVFGVNIVSKNVASYGEEAVNSASETIEAYLEQYTMTVNDIAFLVERLKYEDAGVAAMQEEVVFWTDRILEDGSRFDTFSGVYGFVDGEFIDGSRWIPPDGFNPEARPWYEGTIDKEGDIFYTNPYIDAQTGELVFTVSKLVFDKGGEPFGVIAVDIFISSISKIVEDLNLMNSGYGVLLNPDRELVVAPDAYTNYENDNSVTFFKELSNGWYIGVVSLRTVYYKDLSMMIIIVSVTGFIMLILLCIILAFLHIAKARSDEGGRVKSSFLASMSHEIRTPMNTIIGMTDLLQNEPLSERQAGYVKDISFSSHSLLAIINDILDLSKVESGKLELIPDDYDFSVFVDNIASMFRFVSQKKGLEFQFEKAGDLPKYLYGDDIKLRQVLTNICGNAVKFTNTGFLRLMVTSKDETLEFEIKDTGMGIRKEDISKLFNPFEQAESQKNRGIEGTGLGLAISKAFIEKMGGKITVDSVYGQGTTFTVIIPKVLGNKDNIKHEDVNVRKAKAFIAPNAKVFVVDDNEVNLKVASGLLNMFQIKAETATSSRAAIDMIKRNKFDVVFMDHMMPEMDGIEATAEIRKLGGEYKQLKIIALTANAINGAKEMFMNSGFDGFISKPIDISELTEILIGVLPTEKVEITDSAEKSEKAAGSSFLVSLNSIGSINPQIGMKRVSGVEEMYREALEIFYKKLLSECEKMSGFVSKKDLHNFSIAVHGIKSTLATVGAMELSETAFVLENASKSNELSVCEELLPKFLAELRSLHEQLSAVFPKKEDSSVKEKGSSELLHEKVKEAITAAGDFDDVLSLKALDELLKFDYGKESNELLERAYNSLKDFDYDDAVNFLNSLI